MEKVPESYQECCTSLPKDGGVRSSSIPCSSPAHTNRSQEEGGIQDRASTKKQEGSFRQIKITKIKKMMEKEEEGKILHSEPKKVKNSSVNFSGKKGCTCTHMIIYQYFLAFLLFFLVGFIISTILVSFSSGTNLRSVFTVPASGWLRDVGLSSMISSSVTSMIFKFSSVS